MTARDQERMNNLRYPSLVEQSKQPNMPVLPIAAYTTTLIVYNGAQLHFSWAHHTVQRRSARLHTVDLVMGVIHGPWMEG
jgi:hypothetical protein